MHPSKADSPIMNTFIEELKRLFSTDGFVPRQVRGLWPDWLVWEHVGGNALICLAYLAMPLMIWRLGTRRVDWVPFKGVARAFALFIGLCGLGQFLDLLAFFHPMYRLSGHVLIATGLVSGWTLWSLRNAWPALRSLKSPTDLERMIADRTGELTRALDDLRLAEVKLASLATIVESSEDAIVGKDLDGVVTSWNLGAERIFGYTAVEAVGRPMTFLFPPDRLDEEPTILERLRSGERVDHFESARLAKDGRSINVSLTISPIKDPSGRIVGISKIARDISAKKRVEEALKLSEEQFRLLANSIPQLVWMTRPDGHIYWYNRRWYDYTGTSAKQMEGRGWQSVLDPELLPEVLERWNASIAEGNPFEMVFPIRGADDRFRKFLTRVLPTRDAEGRVLIWFGTNTDIDELTRAEEALRESECRLRHLNEHLERLVRERTAELSRQVRLIDQAHDAILVRSREGVISSWNQGAERLYGWAKEEALGCVSHHLLKTDFPRPLAEIEDDLAKLGSWEGELIHESRDGVQVMVASRWIVDRDRSADTAVLEINSDITSRKEAEEALRASRDAAMAATRAKGDFLANMSHEIRTPMNGVIGMTDLLLDSQLDNLQRDYAQTIRSSGEALLTVINDILDFSKIESGKLTLASTDFDLRALMKEVADLLTPGAHQKNLELTCRVAREVPLWLVGDPVRIRQVLTNLAGNAVKFTQRGEVNLEARLLIVDAEGVKLRILVRDTGIGIPADRHSDIFASFTQIEGGNSRQHGGTGLGLTICQSLVALMGGQIGLDSQIGQGSTFWFDVTFAKGYGEADQSAARLDELRVLVVDDQEADREILRDMLLSWQCRPELAASGAEALSKLTADPDDAFELIMLDQEMPGMNGEQTARVIKALPRYAKVPIVLLGLACPDGVDAEEIEDGLLAARMAKPVRRSLLYSTLCRTVRDSGLVKAASAEGMKLASPLRILLAEDNELNREVAIGMVKRLGCEVEAARNGREALEALDYDRHDLILTDVQMPVMDGFAATAAIRERERGTGRHIPIIAMTAHAMQGDRERCLAAGMDGYLSKPVRPGPLREALRAWGNKVEQAPIEARQPQEPEWPRSFTDGLRASCGNDPKLIRTVLELMLNSAPVRLGRLKTAVVAGDRHEVSAEAHSLKGAFATVGAEALAAACQELMSAGEGGDPASIEKADRLLRNQWEGLEKEASRYLESLHD
jgi:two-component system sensor histidine kinase/response regulator